MNWQTTLYFSSIVLNCILTGFLAWYAWRQQRLNYYRVQYESAESLRKSQEQYRGLIEHATDGIFIADANGKYLEVNPSGCAMLGYSRDEILSLRISDLVAAEDIAATPLRLDELRQGKSVRSERRLICKDGSLLPVEISGRMLPDGRFQSIVRDITERKQVEEKLRESQVQLSDIINSAMDAIITVDEEQKIVIFNPSAEQMFGCPASQAIGKALDRFLPEYIRKEHSMHLRGFGQSNSTARSMKTPVLALTCLRANGEAFPSEVSISQVEVGGRKLYTAIVRDITERKRTGEALRESEDKFKHVFDYSLTGNSLTLPSGEINVNRAFCEMLGYSQEELKGGKWQEISHPDDMELTQKIINSILSGEEESARFTKRYIHKNGSVIWADVGTALRRDKDGKPLYFMTTVNDITERKQAEDALRKNQMQLQAIMDYSPALISIKDLNGNIVLANRSFAALDAPPLNELIGKNVFDIFPKEVAEQLWNNDLAALRARTPVRSEEVVRHKDGIWHTYWTVKFPLYLQVDQPFGICAISNDITERKQAEENLRETNEYLENLFNYANAPIIVWDPQFKITRFNEAFETLTGRSAADVLGKPLEILFPPSLIQATMRLIQKTLSGERWQGVEISIQNSDGSIRTVLWNSATLFSADGTVPIATIAQGQDITERKQAGDKLLASEMRYRRLFQAARDGILILNAETGVIVDVNPFLIEMLGFPYEEICGKELWELGFFKDIVANKANFLELQEKEYIRYDDLPLEIANGRKFHVEFVSNVYQVDHHKVVQCNVRDITARKQAEDAQQQSEILFRTLFELSPDAVVLLDPYDPNISSPIVDCNAAACLMNGYHRDELIGHSIDIVNADPYTQDGQTAYLKKLRDEGNLKYEVFHRHKNGVVFPVEISTSFIKIGERELVIGIDRDITERKQTEQSLRESEERYRHTLEAMLEGCQIIGFDWRYLYLNDAADNHNRRPKEELLGKKYMDMWPGIESTEVFAVIRRCLEERVPQSMENEFTFPDGGKGWFELRIYPVPEGIVILSVDITERKQYEKSLQEYNTRLETEVEQRTRELREAHEQLVRQERLATLGQLAGSIGHELRNPLGVISNSVYYLKLSQPDANDIVKEYLDIIEKETRTSDKIITDLLDFTRIKSTDLQPASVSELIQRTLERFPAPATVDVALEIPADLPQIYVDPQHIVQVFGNLVINAYQAMDSEVTNGNKLKVSASAQSAMIKIDVQDMGVGIPPENMKKLFEPLFTTKTKGIGLGLAVSRKLTEANGGRIDVESEAGKGSTFTVYLPIYKESK